MENNVIKWNWFAHIVGEQSYIVRVLIFHEIIQVIFMLQAGPDYNLYSLSGSKPRRGKKCISQVVRFQWVV